MIALLATLIDVAPDPVGIVAGDAGYYVAGLALAAALAISGVILIRRRRKG